MRLALLAICLLATPFARTQSPPETHPSETQPHPALEVASIRPSPPDAVGGSINGPTKTSFSCTNMPLRIFLQVAFGVDDYQIAGQPAWFDSQRYDLTTKSENGQPLTIQQWRPLLQQLLQERFHLVTHRETRDFPGYALVPAKGGPKLIPTKGPGGVYVYSTKLIAPGITLKTLASILHNPTGKPVIDKTGIEGSYDINLEFAPANATDSTLPSLFTALQEQTGLKLEPQKVPIQMLVIDQVERIPTEN